MSGIKFAIDRGGTFTDVYAQVPGKSGFMLEKLLSEDPQNYADAPREGIRRILEKVSGKTLDRKSFSADGIDWIRMGTTVATNALLERKGARAALVVTKGFGDLLQIGDQSRPHIFDLTIEKPEMLFESVVEANERIRPHQSSDGDAGLIDTITGESFICEQSLSADTLREQLTALYKQGIKSLAVVLMHSYAFPDHEKAIGELACEIGFEHISLSHEVMPSVKIVGRGDTTMVDAYLTPHILRYLESFKSGFSDNLADVQLQFIQSDGGLTSADNFKGSNAILSGPAGGVVGYAMTTYEQINNAPVIGFDMGGTSTDVSRFGGQYELVHETRTAGVRVNAPQMDIRTVAAGGGSRLFFRNGMLDVGPESAGAHPGPVCYRKNGYPAVTDANLTLGRISPDYFPHIFGKNEDEALDRDASQIALKELTAEVNKHFIAKGHSPMTIEEVALGFLDVANEVMVRPIREISVMRGFDVKEHVLACFGGAGGQHACAVARKLGITKVYIHRFAGILSAYGMGLADVTVDKQTPSSKELTELADVQLQFSDLEESVTADLKLQGFGNESILCTRYLNLRYQGTDTSFMIAEPQDSDYAAAFSKVYLREYGFDLENRSVVIDDVRVRGVAQSDRLENSASVSNEGAITPDAMTKTYFRQGWFETPIYKHEQLPTSISIAGPAIIMQDTSTILVEPECIAVINSYGDIEISVPTSTTSHLSTDIDPIQLSIFSNLFMSVAEQMGRTLQKTSISTNIKERLDFSCALFDAQGGLVANAPHLPVHLGAMSEAVKEQIALRGDDLQPGDVLVTNNPARGGSHLPDVTVITPVWENGAIQFFVASRGHHADIGGISPGSMPPFSKSLDEEGVCIESFKLVGDGSFDETGISELLTSGTTLDDGRHVPGTRCLSDNISDLKAQVAANQCGVALMIEMLERYGRDVVIAYMNHIQANGETAVRDALKTFAIDRNLDLSTPVICEDYLDDGSKIALMLTINSQTGDAVFDFSATDCELWGNLNAPKAVTYSAIIYSLRCLLEQEIPLNQGCLNPVQVIFGENTLLSPSPRAAVVGGNVQTSQRVTDVILKAFEAAADSQGCMNNLTFGNDSFGYYETIGGGAGAGPTWHGQSGVHTHMTNTRITDPEILERRYPVKVCEFSIRKGSGGKGEFNGGDGLVRELQFLDELNVAILSERRSRAPQGLRGGGNAKPGKNTVTFENGRTVNIGGKNEFSAKPGDTFRIETPGGAAFGRK